MVIGEIEESPIPGFFTQDDLFIPRLRELAMLAKLNIPILLIGETGVGKGVSVGVGVGKYTGGLLTTILDRISLISCSTVAAASLQPMPLTL